MPPLAHPERIEVVLVSPRNPLNIGAAARAMANFGFADLTVVAPYEPHWREAKSAVQAGDLLQNAKCAERLAAAVAGCTLVVGTASLDRRTPEQEVVALPFLAPRVAQELARGGRVALVFGPENRGLTRDDLALCHLLAEIPTGARQPSMNLGQAVAVCLYELATRLFASATAPGATGPGPTDLSLTDLGPMDLGTPNLGTSDLGAPGPGSPRTGLCLPGGDLAFETRESSTPRALPASGAQLELLAGVIEQVMEAAKYSPAAMREANRHDVRLLLRRTALVERDARRALGLFRKILRRLQH